MKTPDNYIIMIRMLKVLWYYIRPKTSKMLTSRGGTGEKQQKHSKCDKGKMAKVPHV